MATLWITYAWADNSNQDIDFIAQELEACGITVKLDRWTLNAGSPLWTQIEEFIQSPSQCDAWLLIATQASLGSKPCKEEYIYALDRALNARGKEFPVLALFTGTVDNALIPAGIRTRLYASIKDPDWKERIVAAAEGRAPDVSRPTIAPFHVKVHSLTDISISYKFAIEIRPRAGVWNPFVALIPKNEKDSVKMTVTYGPANAPSHISHAKQFGICETGEWYGEKLIHEISPSTSAYILCSQVPSRVVFGNALDQEYEIALKAPY
ncbi:MAG: toll/interleukin-1 receptor domain-containing protein [Burkholderiaceae bacterium]|nr:toll/interleukin-1 receptor domain-containing protein [Burkholderiaceae bacterium]